VHVLRLPPLVTRREREQALEEPSDHVREVRAKLRELSHTYEIMQGRPVTQIVEAAKKFSADLIVMGTRGRTGLKRVLLGSVAEAVLPKAPCPVMTITTRVGQRTGAGGKG